MGSELAFYLILIWWSETAKLASWDELEYPDVEACRTEKARLDSNGYIVGPFGFASERVTSECYGRLKE